MRTYFFEAMKARIKKHYPNLPDDKVIRLANEINEGKKLAFLTDPELFLTTYKFKNNE